MLQASDPNRYADGGEWERAFSNADVAIVGAEIASGLKWAGDWAGDPDDGTIITAEEYVNHDDV